MTFLYNYRHSTLGMVRNFRKCLLLQRVSGGCRLRKECFLHATGLKQSKGEERLIFSASKTEMWDEKCVDDGVLRCGFFFEEKRPRKYHESCCLLPNKYRERRFSGAVHFSQSRRHFRNSRGF